jgi:acyl-CoA synthetase (AMP-forming)/AMP-acid ligase II
VAEIVASGRITRLLGTPTMMERIIDASQSIDMSASRLRLLQFGMGRSRPGLTADLTSVLPSVALMTGYGATECGPVTRTYSWEFDDAGEPIGVGKPVAGADIRIDFDGEFRDGTGVDGEILVNAPWQMDRYCVRDADLDSRVRRGPYLRTGDIGHFDEEGNLVLTGRIKETIRTGGENVYPSEVERWLGRHPSVVECAVYGVADAEWGERVEAAVVPRREERFDDEDLAGYLREHLAGYKVPKRIRPIATLPLTSNHKIDRDALRGAAERADAEAK